MRHSTVRSAILPFLLVLLAGCATVKPQDVLQTACAPSDTYVVERCAQAIGDVYETFQKRAHEINTEVGVPADVKARVKAVDASLTPAIVSLLETADALVLAKSAGQPVNDRRAELEAQVQAVLPRVRTLPNL